ncbi:serine protease P38 [Leptinotarsa decemlineata]|uniref:serine protease P38 n=1 Tax=Leptinotarsa decemlineata TaxID=7539 RepID=UPI000C254334|nr:brachyurin-like [Leptinotarsa decemlineata]
MLLKLIFCLWSFSSVRGQTFKSLTPRLRIIGGDEAVPHAFPYQVGLLINNRALCGASLISENYVLTAAHCATEIYNNNVEVILGAHNITANETSQVRIKGTDIIIHENYDYTSFQNDIALIRLASPAPLNDVIKTVALPSRRDRGKTYLNQETTSIGWGLTEDKHNPTLKDITSTLRVVNVTVMDLDECADDYNDEETGVVYVSEVNICTTGYKNKGTCNGDSGGPLLYKSKQIGIVSIGSTLCEMCSPSVFTKVAWFLDWIEEKTDVAIS